MLRVRGNHEFDDALEGTILHNMASCLHYLDELNEAQEWYTRAISSFRVIRTSRMDRLVNGDVNERRIQFASERMHLAAQGKQPKWEMLSGGGSKSELKDD
eukprot:5841614-Prymnesium_polylepis.2